MAPFRGAAVALLWLPLAQSLLTALEVDPEPRQFLVSRAAEARAAAEVATERAAESESHTGVAGQGVEDPNCPQWCMVSHKYWHVKCTYSHCANCGQCDHGRREAALETEQQQLLGGRSAGSSAVAEVATERATESNSAVADRGSEGSAGSSAVVEVATERAAESNVAVADQGSEDPNCPQWCFVSHEFWHVKCTYEGCANCPMCGPYDHYPKEAALETEQQQLLGGRSAGSSAVAEVATERATESNSAVADRGSEGSAGSSSVVEVATERATESNSAVADQGSEDPNCPQWCFVSHEFWHVKCTYEGCANCPMCGPYDHYPKEAALETEQQQLLGGRSAGSSAVAEVATERAADPNSAVADQGSEDSAGSSAAVEVATERAAELVADQDDPEGVMAALEQNGV